MHTNLHLSFVRIVMPDSYKLYPASNADSQTSIGYYDTPIGRTALSIVPTELSSVVIDARQSLNLTKRVIFELFKQALGGGGSNSLRAVEEDKRRFFKFTYKSTSLGEQVVNFEPYFYEDTQEFGLLADFHFDVKPEVDKQKLSRIIQQHSLMLTANGRVNLDTYTDRHAIIKTSILAVIKAIGFPTLPDGAIVRIEDGLRTMRSFQLPRKEYIVGGNQKASSPFQGIRKFGPYKKIDADPEYFFMFRDEDRDLAVQLLRALKGETYPSVFDGLTSHFGLAFTNERIHRTRIDVFNRDSIRQGLQEIRASSKNAIVIPLLPANNVDYYDHLKRDCLEMSIPEQVVTTPLIRNSESLKWSVANIGLGIFTKLGGIPWILSSKTKRLIIGIGQAHAFEKQRESRLLKRYFAYSVLTEASGRFRSLEVLADSQAGNYLRDLESNIQEVLESQSGSYDEIVLHVPYKLNREVLRRINNVVREASNRADGQKLFAVLRINVDNKFFGYNYAVNSLVPVDGTIGILGNNEVIGWYDGLDPQNLIVKRRPSRPVYSRIEFSSSELEPAMAESFLQDINNLSAANWRGFNPKVTPVSIYYCKLIARHIQRFDSLGLDPLPYVQHVAPWFL